MSNVKKRSLKTLMDGIKTFEDSRNAVKNADFTDLKTFITAFLNTSEPKQRRKLSEEFRKRHMELYTFLKDNAELIAAETDISRMVNAAVNGEEQPAENTVLTNLLEIIGESLNDV